MNKHHIVAGHAWSLLEFPECREYQHKFDSELLPKIKAFKRKADKLKHISYSVWLEGCDCDTSKFTEWGYVNGIPINELNIQCDWKIKGVSDKEFRKQLISSVEEMLHQKCDPRHKYFREEGLGCTYEDWYSKLKKVNDYITQKVGDSTMRKFNYNGKVITAETKEEAIKVFAEKYKHYTEVITDSFLKKLGFVKKNPAEWELKDNPLICVYCGMESLYFSFRKRNNPIISFDGDNLVDIADSKGLGAKERESLEMKNLKEIKEWLTSNIHKLKKVKKESDAKALKNEAPSFEKLLEKFIEKEEKRLNLPKNWKWNPTGGADGGLLYYSKYTGNRLIDDFLLYETGIELENEKEMKEFVKSNQKDFDEFNKLIDKLSSNYILMSLEKDGDY